MGYYLAFGLSKTLLFISLTELEQKEKEAREIEENRLKALQEAEEIEKRRRETEERVAQMQREREEQEMVSKHAQEEKERQEAELRKMQEEADKRAREAEELRLQVRDGSDDVGKLKFWNFICGVSLAHGTFQKQMFKNITEVHKVKKAPEEPVHWSQIHLHLHIVNCKLVLSLLLICC